jgi:hypothetical protein
MMEINKGIQALERWKCRMKSEKDRGIATEMRKGIDE